MPFYGDLPSRKCFTLTIAWEHCIMIAVLHKAGPVAVNEVMKTKESVLRPC